jgi:hypothetical protein
VLLLRAKECILGIAVVGALIASPAIPATKFDTPQQIVEAAASSPALSSLLERSCNDISSFILE